jgi:hypothetical protein
LSFPSVSSSSGHSTLQSPQRLAVWIDQREIEKLIGVAIPMDIFIVQNAAVVPYLKDAFHHNTQLPVLPPDVARIEVTWMAEDDVYTYKFSDLKSLDPTALYDPLINITLKGTVPKTRSGFHISFPCTLNVTAIASMSIVLHLHNSKGQRVPGTPLAFSLRKRCEAKPTPVAKNRKRKSCSCHNGGRCDAFGRCQCQAGFYGARCEINAHTEMCRVTCQHGGTCTGQNMCQCPPGYYGDVCQFKTGICTIPCINGGTCTNYNTCACPEGYAGIFCQKPICRRWCGVHGKCVGGNFCQCYRGWGGKLCNRTLNRPYETEQETVSNKLSRRKRLKQPPTGQRRRRVVGGKHRRQTTTTATSSATDFT